MGFKKMFVWLVILIAGLFGACRQKNTLFEKIPLSHSGIMFNNSVTENDSINPLDMEYVYNGGGVAVGDFNNDGMPDLYFTASQVENRLYLNKGDFTFLDVTAKAGVTGNGRWCNGVSVVDINNDGLMDMYISTSVKKDPGERANLLYINQGKDKDGIPHFKEMAAAYNLADTGFSVQAAFFDYDRDGDLDVYIATTALAQRNSTRFDRNTDEQKKLLSDKLYRNEGNDSLGHPYFHDISQQAGIEDAGYALGIGIADLNKDGWKDIYVTNDFNSSDLLYFNNGDGTFSDKAKTCFKHTSQNAMGTDIADINNDGLEDIIAVDMNPENNFRKKKNMSAANYYVYQSMLRGDFVLQYVRNTLQLNNGFIPGDTGKLQLPSFSDVAFYAGVAETDWSWNASLADFDNDGFKDLIVTNGYPKDVTDHDFAAFRQQSSQNTSKEFLLKQIPQIKIPNYAYRNTGLLRFENVTDKWGLTTPSFSNGAAYADLDADGDLDYVINNINDEVFLYRNTLQKSDSIHNLDIYFEGSNKNKNGIGAVAEIFYNNQKQIFENSPYRGYLSCVSSSLHFGLGKTNRIDSLRILWPDGKQQLLKNIQADRPVKVRYDEAVFNEPGTLDGHQLMFTDVTQAGGIHYLHEETDYVDFDKQKLLPRRFSQFGPSIAVGDVDGNGFDDVFVGASAGNDATFLMQQRNGKFFQKQLDAPAGRDIRKPEMMGVLLFDADGDNDPDLYTASGSNEFLPETKNYQDRLYTNDGKGSFTYDSLALPVNFTSKSCVKAADFDHDGDLDLFVGGRIYPEKYPEPVNSFIYRNDSKHGQPKFTDVTSTVAPFLNKIGMICDAIWSDMDNDGWTDLLVAGEWMPLRVFRNVNGFFIDITGSTGVQNKVGWWGSITAGDFDNDGDMDYVAGNLGLNSFFKASEKEPVSLYAGDFNKDKIYDAVPTLYLPDEDGNRKEFPAHVRDEMLKQIVGIRKKYNSYKDYARATIQDILPDTKNSLILKANHLSSSFFENQGNGQFDLKPLPVAAQLAPIYGMIADDINQDGNLDLMISGNDFGNEIVNGHYDALNGLVMLGNGKNGFTPLNVAGSGLYIPGDGKGLVKLNVGKGYAIAATQNKDVLKLFALSGGGKVMRLNNDDVKAVVYLKNGKKRSVEISYGDSFLSQSARIMLTNGSMQKVEIINSKGKNRFVSP